jgi:hypothetical protein
MRSILVGASLVALVFAVGCNLAPHQRNSVGGGGVVNTATPTVENLVEYLNRNATSIKQDQALVSGNVHIDVDAADAGRFGMDSKMLCQAPRNFLMSGVVVSSPVVDIGSNEKEFWFWSREIKPPYLYHCTYDDLARGVKVPFPFQPDIALTALGLAQYDRTKKYDLRIVKDNKGLPKSIELTEQTRSLDNKPIKKVTVFNYHRVERLDQPQIISHVLKDEQDRVICAANIRSAQRVGGNDGPIIPKMVDFNWPDQKLKMTMTIYNPSITDMPPEKAALRFTRQNDQRPSFDLATQQLDSGAVERAGATAAPVYRP